MRKVKATVAAVEHNRAKYPSIDDHALASRKSFMDHIESVRSMISLRCLARNPSQHAPHVTHVRSLQAWRRRTRAL